MRPSALRKTYSKPNELKKYSFLIGVFALSSANFIPRKK
jgi:hypothetical protein